MLGGVLREILSGKGQLDGGPASLSVSMVLPVVCPR